jgi:hypothetical protein
MTAEVLQCACACRRMAVAAASYFREARPIGPSVAGPRRANRPYELLRILLNKMAGLLDSGQKLEINRNKILKF